MKSPRSGWLILLTVAIISLLAINVYFSLKPIRPPFYPAPSLTPSACGNKTCEPGEYVPCPTGAQCIWAGSCPQDCQPNELAATCQQAGGTFLSDYNECEGLTQTTCQEIGGSFNNSCASPCRHDPDYPEVNCIQVCVSVCSFS